MHSEQKQETEDIEGQKNRNCSYLIGGYLQSLKSK